MPSKAISKRKITNPSNRNDLIKKLGGVFDEILKKPETNTFFNMMRASNGEYNFDLDMLLENGPAKEGSQIAENEEVSDVVKRSVKTNGGKSSKFKLPEMKRLEGLLSLGPKDFGFDQKNGTL